MSTRLTINFFFFKIYFSTFYYVYFISIFFYYLFNVSSNASYIFWNLLVAIFFIVILLFQLSDSAERANSTSMDYHFEILNKNDINRVLQFLRKFFFRDEPLNKCVELIPEGEDSTCVELEKYCMESSFENNLSLMAVSAKGDIIGVVLTGKHYNRSFILPIKLFYSYKRDIEKRN